MVHSKIKNAKSSFGQSLVYGITYIQHIALPLTTKSAGNEAHGYKRNEMNYI